MSTTAINNKQMGTQNKKILYTISAKEQQSNSSENTFKSTLFQKAGRSIKLPTKETVLEYGVNSEQTYYYILASNNPVSAAQEERYSKKWKPDDVSVQWLPTAFRRIEDKLLLTALKAL